MNTSNTRHNSIHDVQSGLKSDRLPSVPPVSTILMYARNSKQAKTGRERELPICILAFSRHNFPTEGFFENPRGKNEEKPKRVPHVP